MPSADPPTIPMQAGFGLAAIILGGLCIPLTIFIGIESLTITLPFFGIWLFLPLPMLAIVLGMAASRHATGVAGTVLGIIALLICLGFVVVDRLEGPDIRAQFVHPPASALPSGLSVDQLMKFTQSPASQPGNP